MITLILCELAFMYATGHWWLTVPFLAIFFYYYNVFYNEFHKEDMVPLDKFQWPHENFAIRSMDHVFNDKKMPVLDYWQRNSGAALTGMFAKYQSFALRLYEKEVICQLLKSEEGAKIWEAESEQTLGRFDHTEEARRLIKQEGYHGYVHYMINQELPKEEEKFVTFFVTRLIMPVQFASYAVNGSFSLWAEANYYFTNPSMAFTYGLNDCKLLAVHLWHMYEEKEHALAELTAVSWVLKQSFREKMFFLFVSLPVGSIANCYFITMSKCIFFLYCLRFSPWENKHHHCTYVFKRIFATFFLGELQAMNTWMCLLRWEVPSPTRVNKVMSELPWTLHPAFGKAEQPLQAANPQGCR